MNFKGPDSGHKTVHINSQVIEINTFDLFLQKNSTE